VAAWEEAPTIIRVIKSRRMSLLVTVAIMRKTRGVYRVWVGTPNKKDHLENLGIDGTIRMKLVFKN
jgi:hypothetical protein